MNIQFKKWISVLGSMCMTLLLCLSIPLSYASDRDIYKTASNGNITVMLTLDQSLSMSLPTWSLTACDAPDGYTEVAWAGDNTNGYDTFANQYSSKHTGKTYSYKRFFCTAKPPIVKSRAYYTKINNIWNIRYQLCTNNAARYEDCTWGLETAAKPANSGGLVYLLPGGVGFQTVWVYFDQNSTKVKLYDRMTRVKDGIYELLYGAKPLDDDKGVGVSFFPVSATKIYKGHIAVPARPLKEVVGATNQRDLVMKAVSNMGPMGVTPLTNVYADVAAYMFGTNTLRRPLQNLVAVERIEWKRCWPNLANGRSVDGSCRDWYYEKDAWFKVGLPTSFWTDLNVNNLTEKPLSVCLKDQVDTEDLVGMTNCYTSPTTMPKYVMAMPLGETDYSKAVWRSCVSWRESGLCNDLTAWRPNGASTTTGYTTWSTTKPNDSRLILDFTASNLTVEQKSKAYIKISTDDFNCPTTGTNVDSSYKITCFGETVEAPAFAVKRIIRPQTIDYTALPITRYGKEIDAGSPNGVWKVCTGGNDADGTCKAGGFTPAPLSVNNGSVVNSTDGRFPNKYDYWSNIKPSTITSDLESTFCSEAFLDNVPGNETGATGICYFNSDSVYAKHIFADTYAGFVESVSESKNMTSTDVLQQTYKRPDAITAQINSTQQCGGQGIYMLTDGEPNGSGYSIQTALYRAALTSTTSTTTARNFNCSNPDFGGANTMWGCAANFSKLLLNTVTDANNSKINNPINMSIRTATVGFGGDYADLPPYDSSKSVQENAALIKDFYGVSDERKGLALLGIYGEGGWYKGASTGDVVSSILEFFKKFAVDIPPLNTGTVTIPLDGLNPTEIQNFAYYPEFKPTPDSTYPLWFGNLKKYKIDQGVIKDNSSSAKDVLDVYGNVNTSAVDMWARGAKQLGALYRIPLRISLDNPDTEVERKLLVNMTYSSGDQSNSVASTDSLMAIDKQHITSADPNRGYLAALLGYSISKAEADTPNLITSVDGLKPLPILRQMGGALHSTPVLLTQSGRIQYLSDGSTSSTDRDEYLAFGTAQGLLQVVSATTGEEKFAFVPFEMVERQKQGFIDRSLATGVNGTYHGIDGAWTAYAEYVPKGQTGIITVNKGINATQGKQWIYGGLRMGGRSYYALDLSDIDKPKLKFYINPDADSNLVTVDNVVSKDSLGQPLTTPNSAKPMSYMGQSWSKPTLTYVNWKGKRKLVMLVGGGYDMGYEADNYEQTNGIGAGVYMFDANDGTLLWWSSSNSTASTNTGVKENALKAANMKYSVVGRINTLDRNNDGLTDHLYFADLGGQLWRVDIDNNATGGNNAEFAKRAVRLLNLHAAANDGSSPRFYEAPNVSVYAEPGVGRFAVVTLGSGNRSQPLSEYTSSTKGNRTDDALYTVFDKDVGSSGLYKTDYSITTQNLVLADLTANANKVTGTAIPYTSKGWYYAFSSKFVQSAKVMGELVSLNKNLYVPVYDASQDGTAGSCGTGVKGVTIVHRLCLPYGKCEALASGQSNELFLGSGLLGVNIGSGSKPSSITVIGGSCDKVGGIGCKSIGGINPTDSLVKKEHVITRTLFPIRWYEQIAKD